VRRALVLLLWLVTLGYGALHGLLLLGVSRPLPLDWLASFVPYVFLPAWLVVVVALATGARLLTLAAVGVAAGHLALLLPVTSGAPDELPLGAAPVRVVSVNLYEENPDPRPLLDEVLAADADVVVVQEFTLEAQPAIFERLGPTYPSYTFLTRPGGYGAAVFSRHELVDEEVVDLVGVPMMTVGVRIGDRTIRVWNVHTSSPTLGERRYRRDAQLHALVERRGQERQPLLVVGDFNAGYWNDAFADLVATDLRDAHDVVGRGLDGSWKGVRIETLIDHVLVSPEWGVSAVRNGEGRGSDHRPVVADLFLRP
jgi:endonuclease/exonuclease/phosphatase (EEP) superfamily protein YafD